MARLIAIGDIHGCHRALTTLLSAIDPQSDDTVVTLGDYVDRGPASRQVIDELLALAGRCQLIPLLGNHEEMMLAVVEGREPPSMWLPHGAVATLDSYGFSGDLRVIPAAHLEFIRNCRELYETETHFFVHASYSPALPLDNQRRAVTGWQSLREVVPPPHSSGKIAVIGHTPDRAGNILDLGHLVCLDTHCYGGKWLSAMEFPTRQVWQANQRGELRNR